MIPYGRQSIDDDDVRAVTEVLRGDWLTTGPAVERFERGMATFTGAAHAAAVSNGTAGLHAAMHAIGIGPGDEVIVPAITFVASANAVVFEGGTPVFADVDPDRLLIDPKSVEARITSKTKAIVAVDYGGHPCDYDALEAVARRHGLVIVADACHSLGGAYKGKKVGTLADLTVMSFHPVKHITTGEGGMVLTESAELDARVRAFRGHGIRSDFRQRAEKGTWDYEMVEIGYNYRICDIQCALGSSQLAKLPKWIARRREIAAIYRESFAGLAGLGVLSEAKDAAHAYHLFVVRVRPKNGVQRRAAAYQELRAKGIGVNVHYKPVHLHAFYKEKFGTRAGTCPVAEAAYEELLSLPMFPAMTDGEVAEVTRAVRDVAGA